PRLADGLRGDDADRLAQLGETTRAKIAPIAHDTDPALGLTHESGAHADPLDARVLDLLGDLLGNLIIGLDDDLRRQRVTHVLGHHAADDPVAQGLDDVAALDERGRVDVL